MKPSFRFSHSFLRQNLPEILPKKTIKPHIQKLRTTYRKTANYDPIENGLHPLATSLGYDVTMVSSSPTQIYSLQKKYTNGEEIHIPLVYVPEKNDFNDTTDKKYGNPAVLLHQVSNKTGSKWGILYNGNRWRLYNTIGTRSIDEYIELHVRDAVESNDSEIIYFFLSIFGAEKPVYDVVDDLQKAHEKWKLDVSNDIFENAIKSYPHFMDAFSSVTDSEKEAYKTIYRVIILSHISEKHKINLGECSDILHNSDHYSSKEVTKAFYRLCNDASTGNGPYNIQCPTQLFSLPSIEKIDYDAFVIGLEEMCVGHDFAALTPHHIGHIHEKLIDYGLFDTCKNKSNYDQRNARLSSGTYYTPQFVVDKMVRTQSNNLLKNRNTSNENIYEKIKSYSIVDPSMGCGMFIFSMMERLSHEIIRLSHVISNAPAGSFEQQIPKNLHTARAEIFNHSLYGVDKSSIAIDISYGILWTLCFDSEKELESNKLRHGNSVIGGHVTNIEKTIDYLGSSTGNNQSLASFGQGSSNKQIQSKVHNILELSSNGSNSQYNTDVESLIKRLKVISAVQTYSYSKRTNVPSDSLQLLVNNIDDTEVWNSIIQNKWVNDAIDYCDAHQAFHWDVEFKEVFLDGGFDLIIGNPPYIRIQELRSETHDQVPYLKERYQSSVYNFDLYTIFGERSYELLSEDGRVTFIQPRNVFTSQSGSGFRKFVSENKSLSSIISFGHAQLFDDASVYTCIITLNKNENESFDYIEIAPDELNNELNMESIEFDYGKEAWLLADKDSREKINTLKQCKNTLSDISDIFVGLQTSADDIYVVEKTKNQPNEVGLLRVKGYDDTVFDIETELLYKTINGKDLERYISPSTNYYIILPYRFTENGATLYDEDEIQEMYPYAYDYFKKHEDTLRQRDGGRMDNDKWFDLSRPQNLTRYENEKIVTPDVSNGSNFTIDSDGHYHVTTVYGLELGNTQYSIQTILAILNTPIVSFFMKHTGNQVHGGYSRFKTRYLRNIPIPKLEENTQYTQDQKESMFTRAVSIYNTVSGKDQDTIPDWLVTKPVTECPFVIERLLCYLTKQQIDSPDEYTDSIINTLVYELYNIDPISSEYY